MGKKYAENFFKLFHAYRQKSGLMCTSEDIFIPLKRAKIIKRGKYLSWSFRDDFKETGQKMAAAIHAYHDLSIGVHP